VPVFVRLVRSLDSSEAPIDNGLQAIKKHLKRLITASYNLFRNVVHRFLVYYIMM
jgi:hypothetical protein